MRISGPIVWTGIVTMAAMPAWAQSSSLMAQPTVPQQREPEQIYSGGAEPIETDLMPAVATVSFTAVAPPEPRRFAMHDLITIIVREDTENESEATLETEKESGYSGEISDFPRLDLVDLLQFQLRASDNENPPRLGIDFDSEFEGEGERSNRDTFTSRLQAKVIDVKPNGLLVLEARKRIRSDADSFNLVVTGTCRAEDVTVDNTVLSTQLADLAVVKEHAGPLHETAKKGVLTKFFDLLFNF